MRRRHRHRRSLRPQRQLIPQLRRRRSPRPRPTRRGQARRRHGRLYPSMSIIRRLYLSSPTRRSARGSYWISGSALLTRMGMWCRFQCGTNPMVPHLPAPAILFGGRSIGRPDSINSTSLCSMNTVQVVVDGR